MKNLLFSEVLLLSQIEKKAFKLKIDPRMTIIQGTNDTGKSSLIKSIFKAFGANPKTHPKWEQANVIKLVRLSVDGVKYSILQNGKLYSIFDVDGALISNFNSVTNGLGPFLGSLLDFKIKLRSSSTSELITPPPAYIFLPFYFDQDKSWISNWSAFEKLGQLQDWRKNIAEYHTGIRSNAYYELISKIEEQSQKIIEKHAELRVQTKTLRRFNEKEKSIEVAFDLDSFKEEITELLKEYTVLKEAGEELKDNLLNLNSSKIILETQIKLVENSLSEINKDYVHATHVELEDSLSCPTCGAEYANSFNERFSIAQDENTCVELLTQLNNELVEINKSIERLNSKYSGNLREFTRIQEILSVKKNDIELKQVLESQGRRQVREIFRNDITESQLSIVKSESELNELKEKKKVFDRDDQRQIIVDRYRFLMKSNLHKLSVHTLEEKYYKNIDSSVKEIGSDLPRALLAYGFSILHVIRNFSTATYCPIVIDSPNQQGQDRDSLLKMFTFIKENAPEKSQVILSTEDCFGVDFNSPVVELNTKYSLLQKEKYEEVNALMMPFLNKSLMLSQENLLL